VTDPTFHGDAELAPGLVDLAVLPSLKESVR
jgi:hypothetical protein